MTEPICRSVTVETGESACAAVLSAIAELRGVRPDELSVRLFDFVDPDALDRIFRESAGGISRSIGHVGFSMAGCQVVVHATGDVTVTENGPNRESVAVGGEPTVAGSGIQVRT